MYLQYLTSKSISYTKSALLNLFPSSDVIGDNDGRDPLTMTTIRPFRALLAALVLLLPLTAVISADDGIWLFNHFPNAAVQQKYGFTVTDAYLDQMRAGSVRFYGVASGSFVSPSGLLFTNHHVASECIQQLSTKEHDYMNNGFSAATQADEKKCPDLEADVLLSMDDVTSQVQQGVTGPSASGSLNGTPNSSISAPASSAARIRRRERSSEGYPSGR